MSSKLQTLWFVQWDTTKMAEVFDSLLGDFEAVKYSTPSEYVQRYWNVYKSRDISNNNLNWKVFELILWTLLYREWIIPLYIWAKVAFVPNVVYDLMYYSQECGPICLSAKTTLRERYKQADLEAIALKYVHRKAKAYLITLDEWEALANKRKIEKWDIIWLDDVIVASSDEFDALIKFLKELKLSVAPEIQVIQAQSIIS